MLAADVQLAEGVLRHARALQDHGIKLKILATWLGGDVRCGDGIGGSPKLGLD